MSELKPCPSCGSTNVAIHKDVYGNFIWWGECYDCDLSTSGRDTEDELTIKEAALTSKIIRTEGLRLVPSDIQEEALDQCYETMANKDAQDPKAAMRKIVDAFASIGVLPEQLTDFLNHGLEAVQPAEMKTLRSMFNAIKEGDAKWADYMKVIDIDEEPPADKAKKSGKTLKDRLSDQPQTQAITRESLVAELEALTAKTKASKLAAAYEAAGLDFETAAVTDMNDAKIQELVESLKV